MPNDVSFVKGTGGVDVLAHELGHQVGLSHSAIPFNLMFPTSAFTSGTLTKEQKDTAWKTVWDEINAKKK